MNYNIERPLIPQSLRHETKDVRGSLNGSRLEGAPRIDVKACWEATTGSNSLTQRCTLRKLGPLSGNLISCKEPQLLLDWLMFCIPRAKGYTLDSVASLPVSRFLDQWLPRQSLKDYCVRIDYCSCIVGQDDLSEDLQKPAIVFHANVKRLVAGHQSLTNRVREQLSQSSSPHISDPSPHLRHISLISSAIQSSFITINLIYCAMSSMTGLILGSDSGRPTYEVSPSSLASNPARAIKHRWARYFSRRPRRFCGFLPFHGEEFRRSC